MVTTSRMRAECCCRHKAARDRKRARNTLILWALGWAAVLCVVAAVGTKAKAVSWSAPIAVSALSGVVICDGVAA